MDIKTIGFYFNCYKNKFATENVLALIRQFYPENKIFLMCDAGDDFSDLAAKYNCMYHHSPINILGGRIINDKPHMGFASTECLVQYLKTIKLAIESCETEYLVFMEDDTILENHISCLPTHSGGDTNVNYFYTLLNTEGKGLLQSKYPSTKFNYWNLAGGSVIHCVTMLECINNTNLEDMSMFDKYSLHPLGFCHTNDITLSFLLMIHGKTNDKWTNTSKSNIKHPDKRFYDKSMGIQDGVHRI